jgi:hypothetical protein
MYDVNRIRKVTRPFCQSKKFIDGVFICTAVVVMQRQEKVDDEKYLNFY